jgi:hypothetical protein
MRKYDTGLEPGNTLIPAETTAGGRLRPAFSEGCSVFGLVDEEVDGAPDYLFTGAALVDARQLLRVRSA